MASIHQLLLISNSKPFMADKRHFFRFRFPWSHSSRSYEEPEPRPTPKTPNPARSTFLDDPPPFRPAKKAPVSQAKGPQKTHPQPSHAASESPKTQSPSRLFPSKKSHSTTQQSSPPSPATSQSQPVEEVVSQPQNHRRKIQILSETDSSAEDSTPKGIQIIDRSDSDTLNADHEQVSESETESREHKEAEKVVQVPAVEEKTPLQERITQLPAAAKDSANQAKDPLGGALQAKHRHQKQERIIELHAAASDSGTHTKHPLGSALQADQRHKKQEMFNGLHSAATDSGNHTKDRGALQADQQQETKEKFETKEILATTGSDEKPIKTERSSAKVSIRKMVASTAEKAPPNKEIREDVSKAITRQMLDQPFSVVTLTGENRGAAMHLSSEPGKQEEQVRIRHSYKLDSDDNEATTDGEVSTTEDILEDQINEEDQQRSTYINSNVQSVNNSIVCNSSVTDRNPGVAVYSPNPPEVINSNNESAQTHKSQVIQTPADRLTYESTVRRRCLRGLFLESSDSEPDNPAKPWRHGCHYVCGKQSKETDIGIV